MTGWGKNGTVNSVCRNTSDLDGVHNYSTVNSVNKNASDLDGVQMVL